jgi:hypothetical protein
VARETPYCLIYNIDFIDSIINIPGLGTRLYTRRSRLSATSVMQRRSARCNHIVNGPPINLLGACRAQRQLDGKNCFEGRAPRRYLSRRFGPAVSANR